MSFLRVLYMLRNLVLLGEADAVFNRQVKNQKASSSQ